ncbi:Lar family restriction alleviation protein [Xenorhabdus ehlersii]|uniref:Lar family restriction alleviation protein n=1 Tax=Xenorhabdus ehlersii TaxID=290111 RepID=UPI000C049988
MTEIDELNSCPFCNSRRIEMSSYSDDTWFYVQCTGCGASGPEENTAENAEIAWNNSKPNSSD